MNRRLLYTLLAATLPTTMAPAVWTPAAAQIDVRINLAPPAPQYEVTPPPRPGYVWAPGHWQWNGSQHVWATGRWEQVRQGYRFVPEYWERFYEDGRERWRYQESRWDRDGDGIPNRNDLIDNRTGAVNLGALIADLAPPPPQPEFMPPPRAGFVWAPGHWNWNGGQYVWTPGRWEQVRAGYQFVPERWERFYDGGRERWRFQASRWDRDGDGIPNRNDVIDNRTGAVNLGALIVDLAPPPPRGEPMPAPRPGFVWAPGHWTWAGNQYVWAAGRWEQVRAGQRFVPERWERYTEGGRERWRFQASRWDRDGDGIPNRQDANDRTRPPGDKDRDGIPNRYDNRDNRAAPAGDKDRDGIPNRVDNKDNRPRAAADKDRDGIPDRVDNKDNRKGPKGDRDGDGIANQYDKKDNRR